MFKIYCVHPISGLGYDEVVNYYKYVTKKLSPYYIVLNPMTGKDELRNELQFKAHGNGYAVATDQAIINRDRWMVDQADIVFANLLLATDRVSIGSVCELAWAYDTKKHVVTVIGDGENIHKHAFILEMAGTIFTTTEDALTYLINLANSANVWVGIK